VLVDEELVRAPVVASWLRELGHETYVLAGGIAAAGAYSWRRRGPPALDPLPSMTSAELAEALKGGAVQVIDLRASMAFRNGHIPPAKWSTRPRVAAAAVPGMAIALVADEPPVAALAARDLSEAGHEGVRMLAGGQGAWCAAGLPVAATPDFPADPDCIDFLFFTHGRHDGNQEAARQYLAWETGLVGQLDAQERGVFRVMGT
jgi:rhodanese-related sulfurtransferase